MADQRRRTLANAGSSSIPIPSTLPRPTAMRQSLAPRAGGRPSVMGASGMGGGVDQSSSQGSQGFSQGHGGMPRMMDPPSTINRKTSMYASDRGLSMGGSMSVSRTGNQLRSTHSGAYDYPGSERRNTGTLRRSTILAPTTPVAHGPLSVVSGKVVADPRAPLLQQASVRRGYAADVVAFLNARSYSGPNGRDTVGPAEQKQLEGGPTGAQFQAMFTFLVTCYDAKIRLNGRGKWEDEALEAIRKMGYPFASSIRPAQIQTIAGKNWHTLLAMFHWIVVSVEQRENAFEAAQTTLVVAHPDDLIEEGMPHTEVVFASWVEFAAEAYPAFLQAPEEEEPQFDAELETFYTRLDQGRSKLRTRAEELETEADALEKEWNELIVNPDPLIAAEADLDKHQRDVVKFDKYIQGIKMKVQKKESEIAASIAKKEDLLKNVQPHLAQEIRRLNASIQSQGMTPAEISQLSTERAQLAANQAAIQKKQQQKLEATMSLEIELQKRLDRANNLITSYTTKAEGLGVLPRGPEGYEHIQFEQELNGAADNPVPDCLREVKPALMELRGKAKQVGAETAEADLELEEKITELKETIAELKEGWENDEVVLEQVEGRNTALKDLAGTEFNAANSELEALMTQVSQLQSTAGNMLATAQARYDQRVKELEQEEILTNEVRTANREALEVALEDLLTYKQSVIEYTEALDRVAQSQFM
ncbi:hypothetical protein MNV49_003687 [Pseudohyphozyma bogoriensis]|nr:hypothetical protein MNV49_003687 [Pseudohyphozyma bogoriensis]